MIAYRITTLFFRPKLDIINTMDGQQNGETHLLSSLIQLVEVALIVNGYCLIATAGYLAETPEEYASTILHVVRDYDNYSNQEVVRRAKASVMRFSDEIFCVAFVDGCRAALL